MYIEREITEDICRWMWKEKILVITGSRQVGKTTILKYLQKGFEKEYKTIFFSIDLEIGNQLFKDPKLFINFIKNESSQNEKLIVFLDEFQYISDSGLFLKACFDHLKYSVQFIVSGSSSLAISKSKEFLTGRKIEFRVNPLSFKEYICFKSKYNYKNSFQLPDFSDLNDFYLSHKSDLEINLINYLNWGGYPEINLVDNGDRSRILKEIINSYLQKDIAGFLKINNIEGYNNLIKILSGQIGSLININELSNTLRMNIETINKYLSSLEGTYIFNFVSPFFSNIRKEISKMRKVYISDSGLRRMILNNPAHLTPDNFSGAEIENFVFNTLNNSSSLFTINYYRTISKSEIDLILSKEGEIIPIEVKFSSNYNKIPLAVKKFKENYSGKVKNTIVITKDYLMKEQDNYFIPFSVLPFLQI